MQDHDQALVHLAALRKHTRAIAEHGFAGPSYRRILAAVAFIEDEVSVHNRSEEEALFPVLERYVEGPTQVMRDDHRRLKREFLRLRRAVTRVEQHRTSRKAAADLAEIAQAIVQQFVHHIHKENHILFPLVQKFLTKDALREIARRMV